MEADQNLYNTSINLLNPIKRKSPSKAANLARFRSTGGEDAKSEVFRKLKGGFFFKYRSISLPAVLQLGRIAVFKWAVSVTLLFLLTSEDAIN